MFKQNEIILAEAKTKKSMITVLAHLHNREEKSGMSSYKGKIELRVFDYQEDKDVLTYYLPKKEAKYLFYRLLHEDLTEPIYFYGGKPGKQPIAKRLKIEKIKQTAFKIELSQGEGEVKENGAIPFQQDNKKEVAMIYLPLHELRVLTLECLNYIQNEEIVAQLNGNPLYDQIVYQPMSLDEQENWLEDFQHMIESEYEVTQKKEEPTQWATSLHQFVKDSVESAKNISLSKDELEQLVHHIDELQRYAQVLKAINQLR